MHTGEIIRSLREKQGMSQEALANLLGYRDRSSIAKIEAGKVNLAQSKLTALCRIFDVQIHDLLGLQPMPRFREIPILGTIACGAPILAQEHIEGYTTVPQEIHADFALVCKGDSMVGARIFDGDVVYIRQQETVENGNEETEPEQDAEETEELCQVGGVFAIGKGTFVGVCVRFRELP